jgi:hypothetical protein
VLGNKMASGRELHTSENFILINTFLILFSLDKIQSPKPSRKAKVPFMALLFSSQYLQEIFYVVVLCRELDLKVDKMDCHPVAFCSHSGLQKVTIPAQNTRV